MRQQFFIGGWLIILVGSLQAQPAAQSNKSGSTLMPSSIAPKGGQPSEVVRPAPSGTPNPPRSFAPPTPYSSQRPFQGRAGLAPLEPFRRPVEPPPRPAASEPYRPNSSPTALPVAVQWLSLEEALERQKKEKRKVFVEVYTEWCGWCKRLDATTFSDSAVAQYLNEQYYPVKFNAEFAGEVVFRNQVYRPGRGDKRSYHELAIELLDGRLGFPTLVFLDEELQLIQAVPGYREADQLFIILNYFGSNSYKTTPWDVYERRFNQ